MRRDREQEIDHLIDSWTKLGDDEFIEALEEMVDRAQTALDARKEELGRDDD